MPGLFDRLSAQLDDDEPSGITPLDIADLPTVQRQIMLALLRDHHASTDGVSVAALRSRMIDDSADLDGTLSELARKGWLVALGEGANVRYRVNLRPKRGSSASANLWSNLSDRLSKDL